MKFRDLLHKAIKPSQSTPQKQGKKDGGDYSEKKTRLRKAVSTSVKPRGKSR